jgi:hypothetical protein
VNFAALAGSMNTTIANSPALVSAATLEMWTAQDWSHGVLLSHLAPHDRLIVRTRNSIYEIVVLVPDIASVIVRGGAFFPEFTPARVAGSSLGGGFLKLHGVYAGFQMELVTDDLPIITTRVRTVSVLPTRNVAVM